MSDYAQVEILLVEDNSEDAELTLRALKTNHVLNHVFWVKDGAEALDFLFAQGSYADGANCHVPRVVLLDIKLPKVDGIEVLAKIKTDARTRVIPVVMLTSSAEERDIVESYRLGVNSYVCKPVDFEKFVDVVSELGLYWMVMNRTPR
ncbi:MAG TPA: response regulator [Burkholderiales bacterium]|nr:response regulator [Burkholderiales bacterium]